MLTKRVIPCFDVENGRVVKGISFVELRDAGDPVELAAIYEDQGADAGVKSGSSRITRGQRTPAPKINPVLQSASVPSRSLRR